MAVVRFGITYAFKIIWYLLNGGFVNDPAFLFVHIELYPILIVYIH